MSHPHHQVYSVEVPVNDPEKMEKFQELMDQANQATDDYIGELSAELGIDYPTAMNVWYLRGRSRWTKELEDRIIAAGKAGHDIIVNGDEEEKLKELGF